MELFPLETKPNAYRFNPSASTIDLVNVEANIFVWQICKFNLLRAPPWSKDWTKRSHRKIHAAPGLPQVKQLARDVAERGHRIV